MYDSVVSLLMRAFNCDIYFYVYLYEARGGFILYNKLYSTCSIATRHVLFGAWMCWFSYRACWCVCVCRGKIPSERVDVTWSCGLKKKNMLFIVRFYTCMWNSVLVLVCYHFDGAYVGGYYCIQCLWTGWILKSKNIH